MPSSLFEDDGIFYLGGDQMDRITVTLPDGAQREYEVNISLMDVAKGISEGLARRVLGAVVDGEIRGLQERLDSDCSLRFVGFEDEEGKEIFWHTSAHVMAYAVQRLYPETKFAIGPAISDGFYYDLDLEHRFVPEDLPALEKEISKIVKEELPMERFELSRDEAIAFFKERNQDYKVELIEGLEADETISLYSLGEFTDLCRGPHLYDVKKIKATKLLSIAGAYWRGDEKNKMLQRIYGISFEKKSALEEYIEKLEEAKKRDHRKIGREMDLYSFHEEGPGFPFYHPKGMIVRNELTDFWREIHKEKGYGEISTPIILNEALWHRSGHWDHYQENMYFTTIDEGNYAIKPMNCPGSILIYKSQPHSYRELPIKLCELGLVHRHELSGALHGLFRVRSFTQDDAHIFMLPSQIKEEIIKVIQLADEIYSVFGFDYTMELSTRPEDSMGSDEDWEMATEGLKGALDELGVSYKINAGDGAFYGPKIDFHLVDALGHSWQCGTIQLDLQMPERFDLYYVDSNNEKKRPVMIHRAILGSLERFLGTVIENYAGKFPAWLSPVQVKILPISDKFNDYAFELSRKMKDAGIRVDVDDRAEKIGFKIREAQIEKVNYSLIVGEKESESGSVSVRKRDEGDQGSVSAEKFIEGLLVEIEEKK